MKNIFSFIFLFTFISLKDHSRKQIINTTGQQKNLFIITTDGFRWQEIFSGADPALVNDETYTPDTATIKMMYWSPDIIERRKKLLPFFWNVIARKGQLYGNRDFDNKVNVANLYSISYPGYSELLTGTTDPLIFSNGKKNNPNINLLEFLDGQEAFHGKVAAFTSWDVFPYILNGRRNSLPINSGYEMIEDGQLSETETKVNDVQSLIMQKQPTRQDRLTFIAAKEYLAKNHPRVLYLGLGETDEFGHNRRYDQYLDKAAEVDRMIAELWHWAQTTPGYKDNTIFLITTDHGRGGQAGSWVNHGLLTHGSSQTWMACMGPGIEPLGEIKKEQQYYTRQMPTTLASMLGMEFRNDNGLITAMVSKP